MDADQKPEDLKPITLDELLKSESAVLRRIGEETNQITMAGHYATTSGHNASGSHTAHNMAMKEKPLG